MGLGALQHVETSQTKEQTHVASVGLPGNLIQDVLLLIFFADHRNEVTKLKTILPVLAFQACIPKHPGSPEPTEVTLT